MWQDTAWSWVFIVIVVGSGSRSAAEPGTPLRA